jgi:FkbH-like protein
MMELKYSEVLKLNKELGNNLKSSSYDITVLSNIIVHQSKEMLEYSLRGEGINANVKFGDYDNIVQDSKKYQDSNSVIIFWELCNIIDGLQYKIELMNNNQLNELLEKTKIEIDLVMKNLEKTSLVLMNKFTSLSFSYSKIRKNNLDELASHINHYLEENLSENVRLVDIEKVIGSVGFTNSLDMRFFYSSKALYTIDFFKVYAQFVKPIFMSATGKVKKALIFDCDNTLWKGILGEDGFDNIEMSNLTNEGNIFAEIQSMALAINKQGILIGLCSKNNPDDVNEVINSHPDMQLKNDNITIKKINWRDKVSNLKEISAELNIGFDSLVFVDDSTFEVNLIREHLPGITVLQVPEKLYDYPALFRKNIGLFYNLSITEEDSKKVEMYKEQVKRETDKKEFTDIEDYLSSLELKITIFEDDESIIPRMSQITQKTNQFNLTTKRYTEGDIQNFINDPNSDVYAFSVADKFGESGVTGLCIVSDNSKAKWAEIDTLLMSCRIIGRNIEYAFMDYLIGKMKVKKKHILNAKYIKTQKNEQVKEFYDKCSFNLVEEDDSIRDYVFDINNYKSRKLNYIEVINE